MKNPSFENIPAERSPLHLASKGFTLMETVIAIGVLAVLLTGFLAVFTPAAQGIRRSISSQQADRLASTLEIELTTLRTDSANPNNSKTFSTGFQKAFDWIKDSNTSAKAIFVYQYRGNPASIRADGTPAPLPTIDGQPGKKYIVQSIARRADEKYFEDDIAALEGSIFYVKPTQLVYSGSEMTLGTIGQIENPDKSPAGDADAYTDAVIAFSADFYGVPTKAKTYLTGAEFTKRFDNAKKPIFTRNLAVRR